MQRLGDGSTLVEVTPSREEARVLERKTILVREIRGRVCRPGGAWSEVRLWTSLLDEKAHSGLESLGLYARRWEQELAYHELKVDLRASGDSALASHTPDTAAQEIAALLVALAMVARARSASGPSRRGHGVAGRLRTHLGRFTAPLDALERGK